MKKLMLLSSLLSIPMHTTIIQHIPSAWLKDTMFYAQDKEDSMALGQLFLRLDKKKMNLGQFFAELLFILKEQIKQHHELEKRVAHLEKVIQNLLEKKEAEHA